MEPSPKNEGLTDLEIQRDNLLITLSGKGCEDLKKLLVLGPQNSKNLGNFLQHIQKSKSFD